MLGTFLARRRQRRADRALIDQIHGEIVAAARAPELFRELAVPDDLDGRFEMMTLHAGLALRRLTSFGDPSATLAQALVDRLFEGFDDALRELAVSDAGVSKRLKRMAAAFYGRSRVYGEALATRDAGALAAALARNAYRETGGAIPPGANALALRVFALVLGFESVALADFAEGRFHYPEPRGELA